MGVSVGREPWPACPQGRQLSEPLPSSTRKATDPGNPKHDRKCSEGMRRGRPLTALVLDVH